MGNYQSIQKINFEKIQHIITTNNSENWFIINTLNENEQQCLLPYTVNIKEEESKINEFINNNKKINIIIYGRNSNDNKLYLKYNQLQKLGFNNLYIYSGGLFEWLLLQDIYGFDEFPTTTKILDILKYK
jgi:rhodanese-related sulfurtransferase